MATIDDILRRKNNSGPQSAPKGSKEWAEQNSGVDVQPVVAPRPNPKQSETVSPSVPQTNKQNSPSKEDTEGAITRMYNTLFATPEQTPEQRAEEEKKQKRKMIINAIGDGISAISNMYFASKGAPSMYSPANSLSARSKERFDRLNKEREDNKQNFYNGWVKAQQIDRSIFENDREHNRKVKNDEDSRAYRAERDEIADERYKEQKEYEKHRDEVEDNRWQQNFDANKEKAENAHNLATTKETNRHNEKVSSSTSSSSSKARGKDWVFSDTNGNEVRIYDNVWQKSMQQVYDVLIADMQKSYEADRKNNPRPPHLDTKAQKEDFIQQNWTKSARARSIMLGLSQIDPANVENKTEDSEVIDYKPKAKNNEIIDYVPRKR